MDQKEQRITEIIVANPNMHLRLMHYSDINQSGTNAPQGHFFASENGIIHPCYLDDTIDAGYRIDRSKAYDAKAQGFREYVPGQLIESGDFVYQHGGKL